MRLMQKLLNTPGTDELQFISLNFRRGLRTRKNKLCELARLPAQAQQKIPIFQIECNCGLVAKTSTFPSGSRIPVSRVPHV